MSDIKLTTLPNGLRVITDMVPSVQSVALGIWVGVGTRNENLSHNGAAHMVEHMLFKGTPTRSALQIAAQVEDVGGQMNAYTSREITSYHIHLMQEDAALALEILADMYLNSTLPDIEVERERQVILQEIGMTHDTPDDLIFDHYYETAYPGQPLGAPILGTAQHISGMTRDALADYIRRFYTPARTVISAAGHIDHDDFVAQVAERFGAMNPDQPHVRPPAQYKPGEHRLHKDLEQAHIVLGFQGIRRGDPDYYSALALSTLLGGGMSSRLFQEVREKRGLVYSIYSFHSSYQDDGQFGIYAGTGPESLTELVPVVCEEILKFAPTLADAEIARARAQLKANLAMGRESMMTRADQQAKHLLLRENVIDISDLLRQIDAVDHASISRVSRHIFSGKPVMAALGPLGNLESYDTIAKRLAA